MYWFQVELMPALGRPLGEELSEWRPWHAYAAGQVLVQGTLLQDQKAGDVATPENFRIKSEEGREKARAMFRAYTLALDAAALNEAQGVDAGEVPDQWARWIYRAVTDRSRRGLEDMASKVLADDNPSAAGVASVVDAVLRVCRPLAEALSNEDVPLQSFIDGIVKAVPQQHSGKVRTAVDRGDPPAPCARLGTIPEIKGRSIVAVEMKWVAALIFDLWETAVRPQLEDEARKHRRQRRSRTEPREMTHMPVSVTKPATSTIAAMTGGRYAGEFEHAPQDVRLRFPDSTSEGQLVFALEGSDFVSAIRQRYGADTARDLLAIMGMAGVQRVEHREAFWYYVDEHLDICRTDATTDTRSAFNQRLKDLSRVELIARLGDRTYEGPLVSVIQKVHQNRRVAACLLHPNPILLDGVIRANGEAGELFYLLPAMMLGCKAPGAIALGMALARQIEVSRRNNGTPVRIGVKRICEITGQPYRSNRRRDGRALKRIAKECDELVSAGLIAQWTGVLEDRDSVITFTPAESPNWRDIRVPSLPGTVGGLRGRMEREGWTQKEAADVLGITRHHISALLRRADSEPLSVKARNALRKYLWKM